ncbi:MAG: hypothetical protein RL653_2350 [Pseudomonadota bacterium]|jgi:predicted lactoylglutathione lyase
MSAMDSRKIFLNLPVKDLPRARMFYESIGFTNNPQFTDDSAACRVLSESVYVMLLTRERFAGFAPRPVADPLSATGALYALGCESREAVKALCETAFAAGGRKYKEPGDHAWEPMWMNPSHVQG